MEYWPGVRAGAKRFITGTLPLPLRKYLSRIIGRQGWLKGRYWYSMELVRDLAEERPEEFHRFLWENHIGYAESYEVPVRFGKGNLHPSRNLLFSDLAGYLEAQGPVAADGVRSVFEVGCSMGYLLRHTEERLFPKAEILEGVDIDEYAVRRGSDHLRRLGSRIRLHHGDMEGISDFLARRAFDVILAPGVLMYLPPPKARAVVEILLRHTRGLLVLTGPASPDRDNRLLEESLVRKRDQAMIHNLDWMVESSGGRVVFRRWEGDRDLDGNTIYFVFATPAGPEPER